MNNLVNTSAPTLPGIMNDAEAEATINWFSAQIIHDAGIDELPRLPTQAERIQIGAYLSILESRLTPINSHQKLIDAAVQAFGELFTGYPAMRRERNAVEIAVLYANDLGELPLFAIRGAIRDVKTNKVKGVDMEWAPTSPRMYSAAENHVVPYRVMRTNAKRVLAVKRIMVQPDPETSGKIGVMLKDFHAAMAAGNVTSIKAETERAEQRAKDAVERNERFILREYARLKIPPVRRADGVLVSPQVASNIRQDTRS